MVKKNIPKCAILLIGLAVPAVLCWLAYPRFEAGIGVEQTRQLNIETVLGTRYPAPEYQLAAKRLQFTVADDGDDLIQRAELMALAYPNQPQKLGISRDLVISGLRAAPLNPRGWTLLCELDANRPSVGKLMGFAFFIAPYDWFVAPRRAILAGVLYPKLDSDTQAAAARLVKLMWDTDQWADHRARGAMFAIFTTRYGRDLLQAAFRDDKPAMRELNRWLIREMTSSSAASIASRSTSSQ